MISHELLNRFPKCHLLVAGATGQLGTIVLKEFSGLPQVRIRAVYHKRPPTVFAENIDYVQADLRDLQDCRRVARDIDIVFMFAGRLLTAPVIAKDPISPVTETMVMNAQMLEAAYFNGVKRFLWLSSSTGYPPQEGALREEDMFAGDPPDVYFPFGWMSRYTETLCRMYATKLKNPMTAVVVRPTTIYSEYEDFHFETSHALPALVRRVVERHNPIQIWGTGEETRDMIYAGDVIDACLLALEKVNRFDVFNVGSGQGYSINELLKLILEIDHYQDAKVVYDTSKPRTVKKACLDLTKSRQILGFQAKTTIREGISRMIEGYRKNPIDDKGVPCSP